MRWGWAPVALLVAVAPMAAFAQGEATPAPAPPPKPETVVPAVERVPPRIHGAHTVDVIAPGEKVETIVERLRGRLERAPVVVPAGGEKMGPPDGKGRPPGRRPGMPDLPGGPRGGGPPKLGPGS